MGNILVKRADKLAIAMESTIGVDPVTGYKAIDILNVNPKRTLEQLQRNVIRNTFDKAASLLGNESVAYEIGIELHGSGTFGTEPESDVLWECAFGRKRVPGSQTWLAVNSCASPYTTLGFQDSDELSIYKPYDIVMIVNDNGTGPEVRQIISIDNSAPGKSIVLNAPLTESAVGKKVKSGVQYQLKLNSDTALQALPSFYGYFLRGGQVLEKCAGNKISNLKLDFNSGQIVTPSFSIEGRNVAEVTTGSISEMPTDGLVLPHIARYMVVRIGDTSYPLTSASVGIKNDLYRQLAITTAGTQDLIRTGREVSGSFSLLYDSDYVTFEQAFQNQTLAELMLISSTGGATIMPGNTFACVVPQMKYVSLDKSDESGLYKLDVSFEAQYINGEDTIFAAFL